MGEGYSTFSTRGGGDAVTLARTLLRHVEDRLAERRGGEAGVGTVEELSAIRAEVATFESGRGVLGDGVRHTLDARRIVTAWPADDPLRAAVLALNELVQRPLP